MHWAFCQRVVSWMDLLGKWAAAFSGFHVLLREVIWLARAWYERLNCWCNCYMWLPLYLVFFSEYLFSPSRLMYKLLYKASLADCYWLITPCHDFLQLLVNTPGKLVICKSALLFDLSISSDWLVAGPIILVKIWWICWMQLHPLFDTVQFPALM